MRQNYTKLNSAQLAAALESRSLPTTGTKTEKISRLLKYDEKQASNIPPSSQHSAAQHTQNMATSDRCLSSPSTWASNSRDLVETSAQEPLAHTIHLLPEDDSTKNMLHIHIDPDTRTIPSSIRDQNLVQVYIRIDDPTCARYMQCPPGSEEGRQLAQQEFDNAIKEPEFLRSYIAAIDAVHRKNNPQWENVQSEGMQEMPRKGDQSARRLTISSGSEHPSSVVVGTARQKMRVRKNTGRRGGKKKQEAVAIESQEDPASEFMGRDDNGLGLFVDYTPVQSTGHPTSGSKGKTRSRIAMQGQSSVERESNQQAATYHLAQTQPWNKGHGFWFGIAVISAAFVYAAWCIIKVV